MGQCAACASRLQLCERKSVRRMSARKPTILKLARGNPGKKKINRREPKFTEGAPKPPKYLTPAAVAEWNRVVPELERNGLMKVVGAQVLAVYCQSVAEYAEAQIALAAMSKTYKTKTGTRKIVPEVLLASEAATRIRQFAEKFGFTPADQSRIECQFGSGSVAEDDLDAFAASKPQIVKGA